MNEVVEQKKKEGGHRHRARLSQGTSPEIEGLKLKIAKVEAGARLRKRKTKRSSLDGAVGDHRGEAR